MAVAHHAGIYSMEALALLHEQAELLSKARTILGGVATAMRIYDPCVPNQPPVSQVRPAVSQHTPVSGRSAQTSAAHTPVRSSGNWKAVSPPPVPAPPTGAHARGLGAVHPRTSQLHMRNSPLTKLTPTPEPAPHSVAKPRVAVSPAGSPAQLPFMELLHSPSDAAHASRRPSLAGTSVTTLPTGVTIVTNAVSSPATTHAATGGAHGAAVHAEGRSADVVDTAGAPHASATRSSSLGTSDSPVGTHAHSSSAVSRHLAAASVGPTGVGANAAPGVEAAGGLGAGSGRQTGHQRTQSSTLGLARRLVATGKPGVPADRLVRQRLFPDKSDPSGAASPAAGGTTSTVGGEGAITTGSAELSRPLNTTHAARSTVRSGFGATTTTTSGSPPMHATHARSNTALGTIPTGEMLQGSRVPRRVSIAAGAGVGSVAATATVAVRTESSVAGVRTRLGLAIGPKRAAPSIVSAASTRDAASLAVGLSSDDGTTAAPVAAAANGPTAGSKPQAGVAPPQAAAPPARSTVHSAGVGRLLASGTSGPSRVPVTSTGRQGAKLGSTLRL